MTRPPAGEARALFGVPFPLTFRNFVSSGLAGRVRRDLRLEPHLVSPSPAASFTDQWGEQFLNTCVPATPGQGGLPLVAGVSAVDRLLKSIHLTGFALEYPDGSLQNLTLSRRRNAQYWLARVVIGLAPRGGLARSLLRRAYARYRPARRVLSAVFDEQAPDLVVVASPGHMWLDHFMLDEAARRRIPSVCVVLSWDNLYSRGPMCRRPDRLLVWSEEMRRQAMDVHQVPEQRVTVVGPLQFVFYDDAPSRDEIAGMRRRVGLPPDGAYIGYVCGARTAEYDVEDVLAMLRILRQSAWADHPVVVRPHPQGDRRCYATLRSHGVLLDESLDITAGDARFDAFDLGAIRHMAALLGDARFVVSSWGTTALLEACIFGTPTVQFRWMDSVTHSRPEQVQMVRDFQRYIHMRAFDAVGAREYCDRPADLPDVLRRMEEQRAEYGGRRARTVAQLTALPLRGAVDRTVRALAEVACR
jgi:hypothetical protein